MVYSAKALLVATRHVQLPFTLALVTGSGQGIGRVELEACERCVSGISLESFKSEFWDRTSVLARYTARSLVPIGEYSERIHCFVSAQVRRGPSIFFLVSMMILIFPEPQAGAGTAAGLH